MKIVAVVGYTALLIAIIHIWVEWNADGISQLAILLYLFTTISWAAYGAYKRDIVILISAALGTVLNTIYLASVSYLIRYNEVHA